MMGKDFLGMMGQGDGQRHQRNRYSILAIGTSYGDMGYHRDRTNPTASRVPLSRIPLHVGVYFA